MVGEKHGVASKNIQHLIFRLGASEKAEQFISYSLGQSTQVKKCQKYIDATPFFVLRAGEIRLWRRGDFPVRRSEGDARDLSRRFDKFPRPELEILFPRGASFRILSKEIRHGITYFMVELISANPTTNRPPRRYARWCIRRRNQDASFRIFSSTCPTHPSSAAKSLD
jgi:hypothetical protein